MRKEVLSTFWQGIKRSDAWLSTNQEAVTMTLFMYINYLYWKKSKYLYSAPWSAWTQYVVNLLIFFTKLWMMNKIHCLKNRLPIEHGLANYILLIILALPFCLKKNTIPHLVKNRISRTFVSTLLMLNKYWEFPILQKEVVIYLLMFIKFP